MKSVHQLDCLGKTKRYKHSELLQAEPRTNMKVKYWKQQIAEEGTVVKLGMARNKNDDGERFVSFSTLNNFAIV